MGRPSWRWGVVAALVAVIVALPSLAGLLPSRVDRQLDAAQLLALVRRGDQVPWSGYAEAVGDLDLPDVAQLAQLPATIGETTRLRAWWRGPDDFRIDKLTLTGEVDRVRGTLPGGQPATLTWDSGPRSADVVVGQQTARLPVAADLVPGALAARLARAVGVRASRIPDRRVAGRPAAGLRLTNPDPAATTVDSVDVWTDPDSGLPLRVEVRAQGAPLPSLTGVVLDLDTAAPSEESTGFSRPPDSRLTVNNAPDLAALAAQQSPLVLPGRLAGQARADRVQGRGTGVGTYGTGFTALTVVPLAPGTAYDVVHRVLAASPAAARGPVGRRGPHTAAVSTPLVKVLLVSRRDRGYLIAGTVPEPLLLKALAELDADPPPAAATPA